MPAINYTAEVEIAKDIYIVDNDGAKSETTISFFFKTWTREGVVHAVPTGVPPTAVTNIDRLEHIKSSPFTIDKAVDGLNITYRDRTVPEINIQDLRVALTLVGGEILNELIENSKL